MGSIATASRRPMRPACGGVGGADRRVAGVSDVVSVGIGVHRGLRGVGWGGLLFGGASGGGGVWRRGWGDRLGYLDYELGRGYAVDFV